MTDSTVNNLTDITAAGGLAGSDLLYAVRPGAPDADYKSSAASLLTYIEGNATAFTLANTGLAVKDADASNRLTFKPGSNLTADRTLTVTTGDADRTLTLTADATLAGSNTGDQTITLTGDVTGSGSGSFAATIANNSVTNAKAAQMAAHTFKGNNTGATANAADLTATQLTAELNAFSGDSGAGGVKGLVPAPAAGDAAAGKFLKADGTFAVPAGGGSGTVTSVGVSGSGGIGVSGSPVTNAGTIALSLGAITPSSVAATGTVTGSNLSGSNTGDQTIALTGDVTGSGTGSFAATIGTNKVTNAKAAQMAANTIKGNNTGSTANAADLTAAQATAMLNTFTASLQGLVPGSGGGTTTFLRADGTFATPAGSSPTTTLGDLIVRGASSDNRLPVGSNGYVLTADNTQTLGVKWAVGGSGSGSGDTIDALLFGDGSDGNATISSGTTTLTRDMYYNNLTLSGTGVLKNAGFRIFVAGTLDITAAQAGAITGITPNNGGNSSGTTAGAASGGTAAANTSVGVGQAGAAGGAGGTANGSAGGSTTVATYFGGMGGGRSTSTIAGGSGGSGLGAASGAAFAVANYDPRVLKTDLYYPFGAIFNSAGGGGGGGGGGGDGTAGGGGGGGGQGGSGLMIFARTINRGGSTAASAIKSVGGNGGNGGTPAGGNRGGGGALIYIAYRTLSGSAATNAIDASGGTGGNGGAGTGTGTGGYGGSAGKGGVIALFPVSGTATIATGSRASASGLDGGAPSGTTGGAGTAGEALLASL